MTCWRDFGVIFNDCWTLSPYWAAAFCSFSLENFCSLNIWRIFFADCWVSTSKLSIHFLMSPAELPEGWLSRMTGVEGLSTSATVRWSSLGASGFVWTQEARLLCLALGLAPKAEEEGGGKRFLVGRGGLTFSPVWPSSLGSSSKDSIKSVSAEPRTATLFGGDGVDGWEVAVCWLNRSFASVSLSFFWTAWSSFKAADSCLAGEISLAFAVKTEIRGCINATGSSDLLGTGAIGSTVRWRCSQRASISTPLSRKDLRICEVNTLSAILLVVTTPMNRPSDKSLNPYSLAPCRVRSPIGMVRGFSPTNPLRRLHAVGWTVLWNLWPYSTFSSNKVCVVLHSDGIRTAGIGASLTDQLSWSVFHVSSVQFHVFGVHFPDQSRDMMLSVEKTRKDASQSFGPFCYQMYVWIKVFSGNQLSILLVHQNYRKFFRKQNSQ